MSIYTQRVTRARQIAIHRGGELLPPPYSMILDQEDLVIALVGDIASAQVWRAVARKRPSPRLCYLLFDRMNQPHGLDRFEYPERVISSALAQEPVVSRFDDLLGADTPEFPGTYLFDPVYGRRLEIAHRSVRVVDFDDPVDLDLLEIEVREVVTAELFAALCAARTPPRGAVLHAAQSLMLAGTDSDVDSKPVDRLLDEVYGFAAYLEDSGFWGTLSAGFKRLDKQSLTDGASDA